VPATREQIEALYRDRYRGFRRGLAAMTGSFEVAHDVVQEAFARALAHRSSYRGEAPLGAWVWGIAIRVAQEERRGTRPAPLSEADLGLVDPAHDPELGDALRALPPRRRLIFFLRYFADMSYREIAAVCEISEGTVAASIAQSRASIARALNENDVTEAVSD
jgi:RNA polymerase sigma-70 factor (ECF subfamily)